MGTWDTKTFDNDDAMDWLAELRETSNLSLFERCLSPEEVQGYLEAPECVRILCTAEVLAASRGQSNLEIPKEASEWLKHIDSWIPLH
jgi:hypothetical protein